MKALLISESDEILNSYAAFFKEAGYDTVCYRWLLKAMDNLEEIEPQLVFIDGFGYPRHWKTLAQYIKTSFKNAPLVLLAADLSEEEAKKADCLDVHCISGSIDDEQTRRDIVLLLHPEQKQAFTPSEAPATPVEEIEKPEQSAFTAITEPEKEPEVSAEPVEEIEEPEVPAADPIQTAEPAELAEPSEESANPEPTTAPSLNDGAPVSVSAEKPAEFAAEPVQPAVEQTEQSAELIAATEPAETAEPVETADFPEPAETVEPETFTPEPVERFEEPEQIDDEPFFKAVPPVKISSSGASVSACAEELAECEAEPVQPEVEPAEQSVELIAATEPAETAEPVETADFPEPTETVEPETFAPEPEISDPAFFAAIAEPEQEPEVPAEFADSIEASGSAEAVFEEPEPIDNEPFFKAVQPLPEQSAKPVDRQTAESENTAGVEHTAAIGERSNEDEAFSFTFFHPRTKTAIYGSTVSFKPPLLYFKPDDSSVLRTLRFGQKSSGIINDKELASNVSVQIQGFENDSIELCLLK